MRIGVVFVIATGAGLALGTRVALGIAVALDAGEADARGAGDADARGAGRVSAGGSAIGVSSRRSTVFANPSDIARSSSASLAPNVARRRRCAIFAVSVPSGEIQSMPVAIFGAGSPATGGRAAGAAAATVEGFTAGAAATEGRVGVGAVCAGVIVASM